MSSPKDKLLESAQKSILKGQLDRAIKDYQQVVALDPKELRHRQRLAELLVRAGRKEEAVSEYDTIGKYYADNSYYLKAIAVYKQIQRLAPDNIKVTLTLASLNEKQGLSGNALAEYGVAVDYYEKNGQLTESLPLIEQMLSLDAENIATCRKYAETLYATGNYEKSYQAFTRLSALIASRGELSVAEELNARLLKLFPNRQDPTLEQLAEQVKNGDPDSVIPKLSELLKEEGGNLPAWRLLVEAYRLKGDIDRLKQTYGIIIRLFPDELFAREGIIGIALEEGNSAACLELLTRHEPYFIGKGAYQLLELLYFSCRQFSADSSQISAGLKRLYVASGDSEKLAALEQELNNLTITEETQSSPAAASGVIAHAAGIEAKPPEIATTPIPPSFLDWEEEIHLQLDEDELPPVTAPKTETALLGTAEAVAVGQWSQIEQGVDTDQQTIEETVGTPLLEPDLYEELGTVEASDIELTFEAHQSFEMDFLDATPEFAPLEEEACLTASDEAELAIPPEYGFGEIDFTEGPDLSPADEEGDVVPVSMPEETSISHDESEMTVGYAADAFSPSLDLSMEMDEILGKLDETMTLPALNESVAAAKPDKYSWDDMFSAFKKGIDQQVEVGDTETHYDLGIAYKEMGLYDDAIKEFQNASSNPARRFDCLSLQAVCYREKGDFDRAEELLLDGISWECLADADLLGLKYELAFLYESSGRLEDAIRFYGEVHAVNPDFHGVSDRIAALSGEGGGQEIIDLDLEDLEDEKSGSGGQ